MLVLSFLVLCCYSFFLLAKSETVQGDRFCSELMCVTAFVNSTMVTYQMTALVQLGWMALGFGTQMIDAKMVIMWPNADGSVTLSQRTAPGLVEPVPDPNAPHIATLYSPLTKLSPNVLPSLAFTVPKDNSTEQNAVWALGVANPLSNFSDAHLEMHLDSGNFTLNLTNHVDTESIPSPAAFPSPVLPTGSSESSLLSSPSPSEDPTKRSLELWEKFIIAHAALLVVGFLVILPGGALFARWGRTFSQNWFYYHWIVQVIISIPVIVTGWALGPLSVAVQGGGHVDDAHKMLGILLFPLYLIQLGLGTFIHLRKPVYPKFHPPRNIAHGVLGMLVIGLAFYEVRTGFTVDWTAATSRSINLDIFSNIWIAWVVFGPVIYFIGFFLVPRQLAYERELPPPYTPGVTNRESNSGTNVRRLLGLEPVDDGTHDLFSENIPRRRTSRGRRESSNIDSDGLEMREVPTERLTPLSVASSRLAPVS